MKPDFLIFNGCSFTEGGGLSNRFILNQYGYDTPLDVNVEYHNIKSELRFSKLVSEHFNCDYVNLAESCNSNDNIFQSTFDYVESNIDKLSEYENVICFIQTTMAQRKTIWYNNIKHNLNSFDKNNYPFNDKESKYETLRKWYELYITDIFDEKIEAKYNKKQIYTIREYLKSKNIKVYFMIYSDEELTNILNDTDYIKFNEYTQLMQFVDNNKLKISDDIDSRDTHFSINGHKKIAEILIKTIEND